MAVRANVGGRRGGREDRGAARVRLRLVEGVARGVDTVLELVVAKSLDEVAQLEDAADAIQRARPGEAEAAAEVVGYRAGIEAVRLDGAGLQHGRAPLRAGNGRVLELRIEQVAHALPADGRQVAHRGGRLGLDADRHVVVALAVI